MNSEHNDSNAETMSGSLCKGKLVSPHTGTIRKNELVVSWAARPK